MQTKAKTCCIWVSHCSFFSIFHIVFSQLFSQRKMSISTFFMVVLVWVLVEGLDYLLISMMFRKVRSWVEMKGNGEESKC
jgi:hypothetical protein